MAVIDLISKKKSFNSDNVLLYPESSSTSGGGGNWFRNITQTGSIIEIGDNYIIISVHATYSNVLGQFGDGSWTYRIDFN